VPSVSVGLDAFKFALHARHHGLEPRDLGSGEGDLGTDHVARSIRGDGRGAFTRAVILRGEGVDHITRDADARTPIVSSALRPPSRSCTAAYASGFHPEALRSLVVGEPYVIVSHVRIRDVVP
jgi:hypothetical protein